MPEHNKNEKPHAKRENQAVRVGGPMAHMMPGGKAKNFKGSIIKLLAYLKDHLNVLIFVWLLVVASTVFSIFGPRIIGNIIDEIINGLLLKISGAGGIDFNKITNIIFVLVAVYGASVLL
ncbi:MAG: ABC transporter ATP-binding protein, partial [Defluviitaleaceae bacterium]|nr:ABC transporter ATP-binding protein [Defluviitaleaceae bacterium]